MNTPVTPSAELRESLAAPVDFSLVMGGPLFQMFRRAHMAGDGMELATRRIVFFAGITWLPLLLLSAISGHAFGGEVPFIRDIEAHVRYLVALPILIAAEILVHQRLRPLVVQFLSRHIVSDEDLPRFKAAIDATMRLRNSVLAEALLAVFVYTVGLWLWRAKFTLHTSTWYAAPDGDSMNLRLAGYWLAFVSVPFFQFILLRWYLRLFLWFFLLFRVSKLPLQLAPTHPDRTGGLGFLGGSSSAFAPILIAQGALLAGVIASNIFFAGGQLLTFKVEITSFVAFFVIAMLAPQVVFTPLLARTKRMGKAMLGQLANNYARAFEAKWMKSGPPADDQLLGNADIQSMADLDSSYAIVLEMRMVPFALRDVARLSLITLAPFLPLTLTTFSLEQLADRLIGIIF